ncbi:hypothetical protein NEHOM01_1472 [Nematocida homosporus]|uniref:uncharacterized protein n=1 Tax=Nematocida homosporus TaxID=1912981 RepID=UPI00221EC28E|nr:uncharacterized protein NEHOM01_1472 [Nematocida homosporus]KAI5186439.1 hypothetical protein NEHOM01_1472 [Nematocida homosporus]
MVQIVLADGSGILGTLGSIAQGIGDTAVSVAKKSPAGQMASAATKSLEETVQKVQNSTSHSTNGDPARTSKNETVERTKSEDGEVVAREKEHSESDNNDEIDEYQRQKQKRNRALKEAAAKYDDNKSDVEESDIEDLTESLKANKDAHKCSVHKNSTECAKAAQAAALAEGLKDEQIARKK